MSKIKKSSYPGYVCSHCNGSGLDKKNGRAYCLHCCMFPFIRKVQTLGNPSTFSASIKSVKSSDGDLVNPVSETVERISEALGEAWDNETRSLMGEGGLAATDKDKSKRIGRPPGWVPGESYSDAWDRYEKKQQSKPKLAKQGRHIRWSGPYCLANIDQGKKVCSACGEPFNQYQPVNIVDGKKYHIHCRKNVITA